MRDTKAPGAPTPSTAPEPGRSFWASPWTVLSLALVVALAVAAVWLVVDESEPPLASAGPQPTTRTPAAAGDPCGPDGGSQTPPSSAPDTTWQLIGSMAAPTAPAVGPAEEVDGVPVCFSPDPAGALFTAATFAAATSDAQLRPAVLEHLAADGPGRDVALAEVIRNPGTEGAGVQVAGFAFLAYTPAASATVDLALVSQGVLLHVPLELTWAGEDWRVVLPVTGRPFDSLQTVPTLAGYVPWQGA